MRNRVDLVGLCGIDVPNKGHKIGHDRDQLASSSSRGWSHTSFIT